MRRKVQKVGINFGTIAEGLAASKPGDLVQVLPGVYEEVDLVLRSGVNIEFLPGAEMCQSAESIAAEEEYTAFTDGGEDIICSIGGQPTFRFFGASELIELTGAGSKVSIYGKGEYDYADSLTWSHIDKIVFDTAIYPLRSNKPIRVASLSFTITGAAVPTDSTFGIGTQDTVGILGLDSSNDFNYGDPFEGVPSNANSGTALDAALVGPGDVIRSSAGNYDIQLGAFNHVSSIAAFVYSTDPNITITTVKYIIATNILRITFRANDGAATDVASTKKVVTKVQLWIG